MWHNNTYCFIEEKMNDPVGTSFTSAIIILFIISCLARINKVSNRVNEIVFALFS